MLERKDEMTLVEGIAMPPKEFERLLEEAPIVSIADAKAEAIKRYGLEYDKAKA